MKSWARGLAGAAALLGALSLGPGCAGPGGSGSSGLTGEAFVVARALEERRCIVDDQGLDFCPTDESNVRVDDLEVLTPFFDGDIVACFEAGLGALLCEFVFSFEPENFAGQTSFLVAAREFETNEPWQIAPEATFFADLIDPIACAPGSFVPENPDQDRMQLAIVVFFRDVSGLPAQVDRLADLDADVVFVVPQLDAVLSELGDEDQAIDDTLASGECTDGGLARFCRTDTFYAAEDDPQQEIGVPPFFFDTEVGVGIDENDTIACIADGDGETCSFVLPFDVRGLDMFFFQIAARVVDEAGNGEWVIGLEVFDDGTDADETRNFRTVAHVALPDGIDAGDLGAQFEVQLAILPDGFGGFEFDRTDLLQRVSGFYVFVTGPLTAELSQGGFGARDAAID